MIPKNESNKTEFQKHDPKVRSDDRDPKFKIQKTISAIKDDIKTNSKIMHKARDPKPVIQKLNRKNKHKTKTIQ